MPCASPAEAWERARASGAVQRGPGPHGQEDGTPRAHALHHQLHVRRSRLDAQQRRGAAAVASTRRGQGGDPWVAPMSGLESPTLPRRRRARAAGLAERPPARLRVPGAGRPRADQTRPAAGNGAVAARAARPRALRCAPRPSAGRGESPPTRCASRRSARRAGTPSGPRPPVPRQGSAAAGVGGGGLPAEPRRDHADGVERRLPAGRPGVGPAARRGHRPCWLDRRARARGARWPRRPAAPAGRSLSAPRPTRRRVPSPRWRPGGRPGAAWWTPRPGPSGFLAAAGGRHGGRPRRWNAPRRSRSL